MKRNILRKKEQNGEGFIKRILKNIEKE